MLFMLDQGGRDVVPECCEEEFLIPLSTARFSLCSALIARSHFPQDKTGLSFLSSRVVVVQGFGHVGLCGHVLRLNFNSKFTVWRIDLWIL
jgi:hypothetical protein